MDNIRLLRLENSNKELFSNTLKEELFKIFNVSDIKDLPENYNNSTPWSLLKMIDENLLDSYQLIYIDNQFWVGSGGIVREFNNEKVYQAGFRAFSNTRSISTGIGSRSYSHEYNTKYQIERAKILGCSSVILSFNEHNKRLFEITDKFHLKKIFGKDIFTASQEPIIFNGVPQWLLTMSLK